VGAGFDDVAEGDIAGGTGAAGEAAAAIPASPGEFSAGATFGVAGGVAGEARTIFELDPDEFCAPGVAETEAKCSSDRCG